MHIHVRSGNGEAKFWLEPAVKLANSIGYAQQELRQIESIVKEHSDELTTTWKRHFRRCGD